ERDRTDNDAAQTQRGDRDKPWFFPKRRQNSDGEGGALLIPDFGFIAGGDLKSVLARREFWIASDSGVASGRPFLFMALHAVSEMGAFCTGEVETRVGNIQALLASGH